MDKNKKVNKWVAAIIQLGYKLEYDIDGCYNSVNLKFYYQFGGIEQIKIQIKSWGPEKGDEEACIRVTYITPREFLISMDDPWKSESFDAHYLDDGMECILQFAKERITYF